MSEPEEKMDDSWKNVTTFQEFFDLHIRWLKGEIKGIHPSGYSLEGIKHDDRATQEWMKLLLDVSEGLSMITVDSQEADSWCDGGVFEKANAEFLKVVRGVKNSPEWLKTNSDIILRESERPYIGGYIQNANVQKLLEHAKDLVVIWGRPGEGDHQIQGAPWQLSFGETERFNLTRDEFGVLSNKSLSYIYDVTNVSKTGERLEPLSNLVGGSKSKYKETEDYQYVTISTTEYCQAAQFKTKIARLLKSFSGKKEISEPATISFKIAFSQAPSQKLLGLIPSYFYGVNM